MTITIEFTTKHEPGTPEHLQQIAEHYFRDKGIVLQDFKIRI